MGDRASGQSHEVQSSPGDQAAFQVKPMSVHIGAEITGLDISQPLTPDTVAAIRVALLKWKVVFFRDQDLDHQAHIRFARYFGAPTPGHVVFGGDNLYPEIYPVAKHRTALDETPRQERAWSRWHTDITAAVNPPFASILRGVEVPPYGGDTLWTNLAVAFQKLSPKMQAFLEGLRAVHRYTEPGQAASRDYGTRVSANDLTAEHPLISVHPENGEKILYVSPDFVTSIPDLTPRESQSLLEMLWEHAVRGDFTVRFRWAPGSVAFWDNRSTAHLAPQDIFDTAFERQFYRVTLCGEPLRGVDGRLSRLISGKPIEAQQSG